MKTLRTYIKTIAAGLVLLAACCINPAAADSTDRDLFVFGLINQYRATPFAHAIALGYDPVVLQEMGIGPETVFAPYALDRKLSEDAAAANAREAAADPEAEPIPPVRRHMARTSSVFSFSHFMSMETAGHIFVQNLFKNELDTGDFQFILSEVFQYVGIATAPGVVADTRMNAWFLSLTLGSFGQVTEMQMLNLINQVRAHPPLTQHFIHTDSNMLFQQNPQLSHLPKMLFSPLFPDDMLQQWARADAAMSGSSEEDVPRSDADGEGSADGAGAAGTASPSDPALPQSADPNRDMPVPADFYESYPGEFFQTATVAASWEDMTTARPVADLFSALLYSELITWPYGAVVFSNRYTQAGVAIALETLENTGIGIVSVHAGPFIDWRLVPEETGGPEPQLVPDETVPVETESPKARIYGLVFFDHDEDTVYFPGEELAQHTVSVYELPQHPVSMPDETHTLVKTLVTDNAGHFSLSLDPGRQWVFEAEKDGQTARRIIHIEKDQFVRIFFSPPYPPFDTSL
ncbi:MAG: hypothetical protein ABR534_13785 [Desulfotignum sp.]|nr:hypothetical protein [Desulfobacteraceae bacterium]